MTLKCFSDFSVPNTRISKALNLKIYALKTWRCVNSEDIEEFLDYVSIYSPYNDEDGIAVKKQYSTPKAQKPENWLPSEACINIICEKDI